MVAVSRCKMIYIVTVVVLFFFSIYFDLPGHSRSKSANICYYGTLIWFICLSGFAYNVGSDIPDYMYEYDRFSTYSIRSFKDIIDFEEDRQPGWVLLNYICHAITPNFVLLKLVISVFCNVVIFRFIRKHSKAIFISILFYGIVLYLHINFNSIRQAIALGFFLIGVDYLIEKKWIKYYLSVFLAFLFHSSAVILVAIPFLLFIPINKKTVTVLSLLLVISVFVLLRIDTQGIMYQFVLENLDYMPDDYMEKADLYLGVEESSNASLFGIIALALQICLLVFVLIENLQFDGTEGKLFLSILVLYIIITILNRIVPVLFSRILQYFDIFYICLLPNALMRFSRQLIRKQLLTPLLILIFMIIPIRELTAINQQSGIPMIAQYAPYYSVFNPKIDPVRSSNFGSHR